MSLIHIEHTSSYRLPHTCHRPSSWTTLRHLCRKKILSQDQGFTETAGEIFTCDFCKYTGRLPASYTRGRFCPLYSPASQQGGPRLYWVYFRRSNYQCTEKYIFINNWEIVFTLPCFGAHEDKFVATFPPRGFHMNISVEYTKSIRPWHYHAINNARGYREMWCFGWVRTQHKIRGWRCR